MEDFFDPCLTMIYEHMLCIIPKYFEFQGVKTHQTSKLSRTSNCEEAVIVSSGQVSLASLNSTYLGRH
jgi:hypothetical protein